LKKFSIEMDCFSSMFFREYLDARNDQKVPKALEESFYHYAQRFYFVWTRPLSLFVDNR